MIKQKEYIHARENTKKEEVYKITFPKLVACYLLAGLLGTLWETAVIWISQGVFEWRNASYFSPFNFIYGSGFILMIVCLHRIRHPFLLFVFGGLLGGIAEYLFSWGEELIFRTRSWDYTGMLWNIGGRTTVPYMIVWGIGVFLIMRYLYPSVMRLLAKIPQRVMYVLAIVATVYIVIDITLTATSLIRYAMRRSGKTALTFIGRQIDKTFTGGLIHIYFPNMVFL